MGPAQENPRDWMWVVEKPWELRRGLPRASV